MKSAPTQSRGFPFQGHPLRDNELKRNPETEYRYATRRREWWWWGSISPGNGFRRAFLKDCTTVSKRKLPEWMEDIHSKE
jgi:hypothetical protein